MRYVFTVLKWFYGLVLFALAALFIAEIFGAHLIPDERVSGFLLILFLFMLFFTGFAFLVRSTPQSRW